MSVGMFRRIIILAILFSKLYLGYSLECFHCSSISDASCISVPNKIVTCSNYSTGCVKLTVEAYEMDKRVVLDKEQLNNKKINKEILKAIFTPEPYYVTLRKCSERSEHLGQPSSCRHIFDTMYNISICMCENNLCNTSTKYGFDSFLQIVIFCLFSKSSS